MKIIIYSPAFPPRIGGLEEIARLAAEGLSRLGHAVTVICDTPAVDFHAQLSYRVLRMIPMSKLWEECCDCDVFFMFNMSLKALPIPVLARKPIVICHQGWYNKVGSTGGWDCRAFLKRKLSRLLAYNLACSRAVAKYIGGRVSVVPNAYDDRTFRLLSDVGRRCQLLFVGRLVSDKGAGLLLDALALLRQQGFEPDLTITGSGPEREVLEQQVKKLGMEEKVRFTGPLKGQELAKVMCAHRVLVVPSLWAEPFGIVALEGAACGCLVVASNAGGLADAVGPCGYTFPNGNAVALAELLGRVLRGSEEPTSSKQTCEEHLEQHRPAKVVDAYERALLAAVSHPPVEV